MSPETARACLDSCIAHGRARVRSVIITGGEPFFSPTLLASVLQHATSLGLLCVVITNGYWATNRAVALATLHRFPEIGLLTISTDRYHRAFVSPETFRTAVAAARELAIPCTAAVCADSDAELEATVCTLEGVLEPDQIRVVRTLPAGRAATRVPPARKTHGLDDDGPCTGADIPIVFPDGRVIACMGIVDGLRPPHPLWLGNVRETPLGELLARAEQNVFLHAMRALGPGVIIRPLDGEEPLPQSATAGAHGACSLCYAMAADGTLLQRVRDLVSVTAMKELTVAARRRVLGEPWEGQPARCGQHREGECAS
jgi:MoaA/NifB/PqqE/SkfB family radical SAM enzyme